jgi:YHS domain-containing protein
MAALGNVDSTLAQSGTRGYQNRSQGRMSRNTIGSHQTSRAFTNGFNVSSNGIAIEGYCPVCYLAVNRAVKGTPRFSQDYNGITYWFVNENARQAFLANPEQFLPAYGGWCATGVAIGQRLPVDPESFKIVDGRIMLFLKNAKVNALDLWNQDESGNLAKAETNWKKLGG